MESGIFAEFDNFLGHFWESGDSNIRLKVVSMPVSYSPVCTQITLQPAFTHQAGKAAGCWPSKRCRPGRMTGALGRGHDRHRRTPPCSDGQESQRLGDETVSPASSNAYDQHGSRPLTDAHTSLSFAAFNYTPTRR